MNGSDNIPDGILMNGKGAYMDPSTKTFESLTVTQGMKLCKNLIYSIGISLLLMFDKMTFFAILTFLIFLYLQERPIELGYQMWGLHGVSISESKVILYKWWRQKDHTPLRLPWILLMCMLASPTLFLSPLIKLLQTIIWLQLLNYIIVLTLANLALVCSTILTPQHLQVGLFQLGRILLTHNSQWIKPKLSGNSIVH